MLFDLGLDVNSPLSSGWTALMYAAHSSAVECIGCLIRHGADPNSHKGQINDR
jgi:ankyrin repeat protein